MDIEWFKDRKKELKLTDVSIGEALGRDRSIANRLINGKLAPDLNHVDGLAKVFRVNREEILQRLGVIAGGEIPPNARPFKMEGASEERMREDLPIYGTALGAARYVDSEAIEQTTLNQAEVVQYAKRPVVLNGNSAAYGLFVSGHSMEPRYRDGEIILIDPKGRYHAGDDVVVYLRTDNAEEDNGEAARAVLVKKLVRRTVSYIELEQYTPAITFRVEMTDVVSIHRVIPWGELLT